MAKQPVYQHGDRVRVKATGEVLTVEADVPAMHPPLVFEGVDRMLGYNEVEHADPAREAAEAAARAERRQRERVLVALIVHKYPEYLAEADLERRALIIRAHYRECPGCAQKLQTLGLKPEDLDRVPVEELQVLPGDPPSYEAAMTAFKELAGKAHGVPPEQVLVAEGSPGLKAPADLLRSLLRKLRSGLTASDAGMQARVASLPVPCFRLALGAGMSLCMDFPGLDRADAKDVVRAKFKHATDEHGLPPGCVVMLHNDVIDTLHYVQVPPGAVDDEANWSDLPPRGDTWLEKKRKEAESP
jgi:hypothetical protein